MPSKAAKGSAKRAQPARRDIAVLDTAARQRRLQKYLDDLERDNYATQVPIDLSAFLRPVASTTDVGAGRRKRARLDLPKRAAFKKSVSLLVDESNIANLSPAIPTYLTCAAPPPREPARHLCAVCGFSSSYTCVHCGVRFCSIKCKETHSETRCMKFVM